jgi:hypothetical protein
MLRVRGRRTRLLLALWAAAACLAIVLTVGPAQGAPSRPGMPGCTHGLSSLGPVQMVDGKIVGGSTTPETEACLP